MANLTQTYKLNAWHLVVVGVIIGVLGAALYFKSFAAPDWRALEKLVKICGGVENVNEAGTGCNASN